MSDRKPAGMNFETWVDAQIRQAKERGEFDNLAGHGKPLKDIDSHDEMWWIKQWLKRENLSFTPPALELRRKVEDLLSGLGNLRTERMLREVVAELNDRIRAINRVPPSNGPPSSLMPLDVEEIVTRWRTTKD